MAKNPMAEGYKSSGDAVGNKISKIMHEGVRRNTRVPVSASNPRRAVPQKQAVAIALSEKRRGKL